MNIKWHGQHLLPKRASVEQRIEWHREHQVECACRPIPERLLAQLQESSRKPPVASMADAKFSNVVLSFADQRSVRYGGKGFGSSALQLDGKIFALLTARGQFVVKLSKERVEALVEQGKGEYFDPGHGRLMKEWFVAGSASTRWLELAREAHTAASGRRGRTSRPSRPRTASRRSKAPRVTKARTRPR